MARILFIACMLVTWGSAVTSLETSSSSPSASPGPSPSGDCSDVTYNMADCFDFLTKGSNFTKPSSSCCSGFEAMVNTNDHCICEALKSSNDLGLNLNVTRAISLSSVCGISAPHTISKCDIASPSSPPAPVTPPSPPKKSPSPSPLPPKQSPAPSPSNPPAPVPSGSETPAPAPLPNPNSGDAYSTAAASITVVIISSMLVAASLSV